MRRHSDLFPLVLGGAGIALYALLLNIYETAFQAWFLAELKQRGYQDQWALVVSRLLPIVPSIGAVVAIIWLLYRYIKKDFEKSVEAFSISPGVYAETRALKSLDGRSPENFYQSIFYLVVGHALPEGETIKRVQMRTFFHGPPLLSRIKDTDAGQADLRHGEVLFFEIGRLISTKVIGMFQGFSTIEDGPLKAAEHNIPLGHFTFEISPHVGRGFNFGNNPKVPSTWPLYLTVSADDVVSKQVAVVIDVVSAQPVTISSIA